MDNTAGLIGLSGFANAVESSFSVLQALLVLDPGVIPLSLQQDYPGSVSCSNCFFFASLWLLLSASGESFACACPILGQF